MTSQLNTNNACPSSFPMWREDSVAFPRLPPPSIPPPMLPPSQHSRQPFLPPVHQVPPPLPPTFHPLVPPPTYNPSLLPSVIHSFPPPPIPFQSSSNCSDQRMIPVDEFRNFIQTWEERYKNIPKEKSNTDHIKVSDIKKKLVQCYKNVKVLESLSNFLQATHKSLSDEDWYKHCKEAEKIKAELSTLMDDLNNPRLIRAMKRAVLLRKKKRDYKKRKAKEWQEKKREAKFYAEQEHRRIDLWLENMKDQVSRAKREEDIKREADLVLSDVTTKKAEAKRMLNMLNSLAKLRAARALTRSAGRPVPEQEGSAFTQVIERLKKMWLDQFNGYKVEEEGLKVMLGHAEETRTSNEVARLRKNLKAWNQGIFGSSQSTQPQSFDELVQIRQDWDKFICTDNAPMASSIPVGWVLPCEPSSEEWAALLIKA